MSMSLFTGVIEDIMDPLKLGRVRVRVFGLHTDDKTLIPTESLPWATVSMPANLASMSGIGQSPTGLLPGSWVILTFRDQDNQYPIVLSSLHGLPEDPMGQLVSPEQVDFSDSESQNENVLKDSSGNTVTDSSGSPIKTEPTVSEVSPKKVIPSELGSVSGKYESNGNPGAINNYKTGSDRGGASYGAYQFASYITAPGVKTRSDITNGMVKNSPINIYLSTSKFGEQFSGLSPATPEFDAKWKSVGRDQRVEFLSDQHKYIEKNYYQIAIGKLPPEITNRGRAIHEAIWSMSVQMGPGSVAGIFKNSVGTPDKSVNDQTVIKILYDYRIATIPTSFKSSPGDWKGLKNRFVSERDELIKMASLYEVGQSVSDVDVVDEDKTVYDDEEKTIETSKKVVPIGKSSVIPRGFIDPTGSYPLYYNESDVNRLSRGVITGTIVESKRNNIISKAPINGGAIAEPVTQYNAKYPFNHVMMTQSGHIMEFDDTSGYERVQLFHRSGTFIEMHPDGQLVTKTKSVNTFISNADSNSIILGNNNIHISGNSNVASSGSMLHTYNSDSSLGINANLNIIVSDTAKFNSNQFLINCGEAELSSIEFVEDSIQVEVSETFSITPSEKLVESSTRLSDQAIAATSVENYIAAQDKDGQNVYYNKDAEADGVKGNYAGTPDDNEIPDGEISSDVIGTGIIQVLNKILTEADSGKWRETGQAGKPSNPNIIGLWKNLGFPGGSPWNTDQTAWCMGFVNFVLKASGNKYVKTASARAITTSPTKWNAIQVNKEDALPGDIAFWSYSHVNFVYSNTGGKFSFCGGNQTPKGLKGSNNPNDGDVTISYPNGTSASNSNWVSCWRIQPRTEMYQ